MISLGRRGLLKFMGAAPAVVAMAPAAAVQSAGYGVAGLGASAASLFGGVGPQPCTNVGTKFFSFAKWLTDQGEKELRDEARHVGMVDADIASMRLPLTTKVRMQRERNYERVLDRSRGWFMRQLAQDGVVTRY